MTDSLEPRENIDGRLLWVDTNSGPGFEVWEPTKDTRPAFDPVALIIGIQRLLRERGIEVDPQPSQLHVATIAAADLLRALHVRPETAPMRKPE